MHNKTPDHTVINAIHRRFDPETAADIISKMWWSAMNGCWHFDHAGMLFGVETDGYIHT